METLFKQSSEFQSIIESQTKTSTTSPEDILSCTMKAASKPGFISPNNNNNNKLIYEIFASLSEKELS